MSETPQTIDERLAEAINEPRSATNDGVSATQHSLAELIAAAKFLAAQKGAKQPHRGLRFTKLVPPGAR